jgi:hypothetical protein
VVGFGTGDSEWPFKDAKNKVIILHDPCFPEEHCPVEESQSVLIVRVTGCPYGKSHRCPYGKSHRVLLW